MRHPVPAAKSPAEIPGQGWVDVLRRSIAAMAKDSTSVAAAGIAFYMVWAFFPAVVVVVVLAARTLGRTEVLAGLAWIRLDVPDTFNAMVVSQLDAIADHSRALSLATLSAALAFASWSGMRGARSLMTALNLVYRQRERRSFWHRQAIASALCVTGGAFVLLALALIVGLAGTDGPTPVAGNGFLVPSRWPVLIVGMMLLLSVAYRYGPCRRLAKWRWVTWGAAATATIWVLASAALSYYTAHYRHFNPILGSLGSVVIFLFWCYLTVLAALFGAYVNAELERHTSVDSGAGAARPIGRRGAKVADTERRVDRTSG